MTKDSFQVYVDRLKWGRNACKLVIMAPVIDYQQERYRVLEYSWKEITGFHDDFPGLELSITQCQHLIDQLWDAGLRPSEGSGSAGSLAATQDHLKTTQEIMNRLLTLVEIQRKPIILHTVEKR